MSIIDQMKGIVFYGFFNKLSVEFDLTPSFVSVEPVVLIIVTK